MLVINHIYELPFGSGRAYLNSGAMSKIVGGWGISGTWVVYTGQWFAASLGTPDHLNRADGRR